MKRGQTKRDYLGIIYRKAYTQVRENVTKNV